ncbi:hypothetical protein ACH5RR_018459 [Cinchona calisaya]|uniref:Secreted protein n=1 Tax=Cinchona calisaya TaxID=153742 RepID=A0ABD2ZLJ0_9GENT
MDTRFLVEKLSLRSGVIPLLVTRVSLAVEAGRATGPAVATEPTTLASWTAMPPSSTLEPVMWATAPTVWVAVKAF